MSFRTAVSTFRGHRQPHFNIIGHWKRWFTVSGILIVLSLIGLLFVGLNYSIDFKGGAQLRYPNTNNATVADVQRVLAQYGRGDAEVQVVGTSNGGSEIVIRTRSLNDLGGAPQTQFTFPTGTATEDDVKEALAQFGLVKPNIKLENGRATVLVAQGQLGTSNDVTIVYQPTQALTVDEVKSTLAKLGRSGAQVLVFPKTGGPNGTVIIRTPTLTPPTPSPSPSPSGSASPTGTPSPSASGSPSSSASPTTTTSSGASAAAAAAAAAAAPTKAPGKQGGNASPKASGNPSPSTQPSPTTEPSPTVAPSVTPSVTPAPSPTGPPSQKDILAAIAKQAGIDPGQLSVNQLSSGTQAALAAALADSAGIDASKVQVKEIGGDERARLLNQLGAQAGIGTDEIVINDVGPTWGAQISSKAIKGLIIFLVLVTLYISFRFEWKMGVSALTALAHDLIITAGIYALVGRLVTPETVIAILTILGYSLYDTVVIFDRVKENTESLALVSRDGYSSVVNLSLNETLMRSVNTSLVVLLPILSLLLFGGDTLKDFAFALFIGVASGTYSSIFIASPMLALLKEREPRYTQMRARAVRAQTRGQGQVAVATTGGRSTTTAGRPTSGPTGSSAKKSTATASPPAAPSGDGSAGDGAAAKPATSGASASEQAKSGSGSKPSGSRPSGGGSRSKSKKRPPPAKRRRR